MNSEWATCVSAVSVAMGASLREVLFMEAVVGELSLGTTTEARRQKAEAKIVVGVKHHLESVEMKLLVAPSCLTLRHRGL